MQKLKFDRSRYTYHGNITISASTTSADSYMLEAVSRTASKSLEKMLVTTSDRSIYHCSSLTGLTPVQNAVFPSSQFLQRPSATLKGITTRSPFLSKTTPAPASVITPMFSWPKIRPVPPSAAVLPSYLSTCQHHRSQTTCGGNFDM